MDQDDALTAFRKAAFPFRQAKAKKLGAKSRVGQGKGRDGDGDGILNEAANRKKGGLNKGPVKTWVLGKGRPLPSSLHGVPFKAWDDAPTTPEGWASVVGQNPDIAEPPMPKLEPNQRLGSGVIIREPDGRVWITKPTNGFGGYLHTFPKGGVEEGLSAQANAIKEAFEETGLQVRITGFAADVKRSTSQARYYFAERTGGTPTAHGWESEAVVLAPPETLPKLLNAYVDQDLAHKAVGSPKPPPPSPKEGVWAGLNGGAAPLGAKSAPKPLAGLSGSGKAAPSVPVKGLAPKVPPKPFPIGQGAPTKPKKASTFSDLFDWESFGWMKSGKVKKAAKLPKKLRVGTKTGLPPGHPAGKAPKDMDNDGKVFDGTPYEQPASAFKKPSSGAAPKPASSGKSAAEIHGMGSAMSKWPASNGAAQAAKKAILQYEALHAANDLPNLKASLANYDALQPGKGNSYTKAKALAHKALVADLEAKAADAIAGTAPKSVAIRLPKPAVAAAPAKAVPTPAPAAAMSRPVVPKTVGWKNVGGQLGSNPGVQATNAAGEKFYVKFAKSPAHAANEVTGAHLYELAGHSTLKPGLIDATPLGGNAFSTATKWEMTTKFNPSNPAHMAAAQADFATHAWLGNWDAIGASFDNLAFAGTKGMGKALMVDTGGTMLFRAQGGPKGLDWGDEVVEWNTLRSPKTPGNAPAVFGPMTSQQLFESAKKVAAIPDESIVKVVMTHGPGDDAAKKALADTLIARKKSIIAQANELKVGSKLLDDGSVVSDAAMVTKVVEPPQPKAPRPVAAASGTATPLKGAEIKDILSVTYPPYAALTPAAAKAKAAGSQMAKAIEAAETGNIKALDDILKDVAPDSGTGKFAAMAKDQMMTAAPKLPAAPVGIQAIKDVLPGAQYVATEDGMKFALINQLKQGMSAGQKAALTKKYVGLTPEQAFKEAGGKYAAAWQAYKGTGAPVATAAKGLPEKQVSEILAAGGFVSKIDDWTGKLAQEGGSVGLHAAAVKAALAGDKRALDDAVIALEKMAEDAAGNVQQDYLDMAVTSAKNMQAKLGQVGDATAPTLSAAKAAPEAMPSIKTPPALPASIPPAALSSPANPNKTLIANHQKVVEIGEAYAKGTKTAQQALDELSAIKFGSNSFGQKAAKHQAATMAAIGAHGGITQAAAKAGSAIPAPAALAIPKPKPSTPKGPKTWDAATDAKKVSEPPNFMQWGGSGKPGPSSVQGINQANFDATQAIYALAKKGDVDGIKALKVPVFNKDTNSLGAEVLALNHPSQHVKGYAEQALAEIDSILNPTKAIRVRDVEDLVDLANKHPAIPIADVSKVERIGYYAVVGKVPAASAEEIGAALYKPGVQKTTANKKLTSQTYQAEAAKAWKAMSSTQKSAIKSHTGSGYGYMNDALWKGNETAAAAAVRSGIVTHGHYIEPGTVLRRNIDLDQKTRDKLLNAVGHTLMEPANMSTSLAGAFGNSRNTRLNITVGPNVKGLFVSANVPGEGVISAVGSGEAEMLIPSGARIFVRGTKIENGRLVVDVLLLPNDTL